MIAAEGILVAIDSFGINDCVAARTRSADVDFGGKIADVQYMSATF